MKNLLLPLCGMLFISAAAQQAKTGPVFQQHGAVYTIDNPDFPAPTTREYHVVFDVGDSPAQGNGKNPKLETAARFLNLHHRAGIPLEQLKVALVVHGMATLDLLDQEAYREKFQKDNPNLALMQDLLSKGVQVIQCGQSASYRGIAKEDQVEGVQRALSAMTALVLLQSDGYQFIKF